MNGVQENVHKICRRKKSLDLCFI